MTPVSVGKAMNVPPPAIALTNDAINAATAPIKAAVINTGGESLLALDCLHTAEKTQQRIVQLRLVLANWSEELLVGALDDPDALQDDAIALVGDGKEPAAGIARIGSAHDGRLLLECPHDLGDEHRIHRTEFRQTRLRRRSADACEPGRRAQRDYLQMSQSSRDQLAVEPAHPAVGGLP